MSFHVKPVVRSFFLLLLLPFWLSGCGDGETTPVTQVTFSLLYPEGEVVAEGDLTSSLSVVVTAGGEEQVLTAETTTQPTLYVPPGSATSVQVILTRVDGRGYYAGTKEGVEITAGGVTDLGEIALAAYVADAGGDHIYRTGDRVQLDTKTATFADGTPLSYQWEIVEKPVGSMAALSSTSSARTDFTSDVDGFYRLKLTMSDGNSEYVDETVIRAVTLPATYSDSTTAMNFTLVPGGCYAMGDGESSAVNEKPEHEVCVDSFYMGTYEVTQGEWMTQMESNPSLNQSGDSYPVEQASWEDATLFTERLSTASQISYRLPTEAEWEYAARSGGKDEQWSGTNDELLIGDYAWFKDNDNTTSMPVGTKLPNGLGLYDMSGNVYEWAQDWYDPEYDSSTGVYAYYARSPRDNPQGPEVGSKKIVRGGHFKGNSYAIRTSLHAGFAPTWNTLGMVGLRLALPVAEVLGE